MRDMDSLELYEMKRKKCCVIRVFPLPQLHSSLSCVEASVLQVFSLSPLPFYTLSRCSSRGEQVCRFEADIERGLLIPWKVATLKDWRRKPIKVAHKLKGSAVVALHCVQEAETCCSGGGRRMISRRWPRFLFSFVCSSVRGSMPKVVLRNLTPTELLETLRCRHLNDVAMKNMTRRGSTYTDDWLHEWYGRLQSSNGSIRA